MNFFSKLPAIFCYLSINEESFLIQEVAMKLGKQCVSIAIGGTESCGVAENEIKNAAKGGYWILIRNVHLMPEWLLSLQNVLQTLNPDQNFRLLLTFEVDSEEASSKIPVDLLLSSYLIVHDRPCGVKNNLLQLYSSISKLQEKGQSKDISKLYFILAWLHTIIVERFQYVPLGWTKKYDINICDFRTVLQAIENSFSPTESRSAKHGSTINIQWETVSTILYSIYGAKIDHSFDLQVLTSLMTKFCTPHSLDPSFHLVPFETTYNNNDVITMPDTANAGCIKNWLDSLDLQQSPAWLGLPISAEEMLQNQEGNQFLSKLKKIRNNESGLSGALSSATMETLKNEIARFSHKLHIIEACEESFSHGPLSYFFMKENNLLSKLLININLDLKGVISICKGNKQENNTHHHQIMKYLLQGIIPPSWHLYPDQGECSIPEFTKVMRQRVIKMFEISELVSHRDIISLQKHHVWLGGLRNPKGYLTVTQQYTAQIKKWPLEELFLYATFTNESSAAKSSNDVEFAVTGLFLQGANCHEDVLSLSESRYTDIPVIWLRWLRRSEAHKIVQLPVYRDSTRRELIFTVGVNISENDNENNFFQRGVAFLTSTAFS